MTASARSDDDAMPECIVEEERHRNRRHPAATLRADGGLRAISASLVVDDTLSIASSSFLDLARQTHPQNATYS